MGGHSNYKLRTMDMLVQIQDKLNECVKDQNNIEENVKTDRHKKWENIKRKDKIEKNRLQLLEDKDVKKKKGTQPKKYYKSLSKDVKSKRADHFAKQDTTKGPYKPAPGDKGAKTKPSIHTKKYKQMYGEMTQNEACWDGYKAVGMKKKNGSYEYDSFINF